MPRNLGTTDSAVAGLDLGSKYNRPRGIGDYHRIRGPAVLLANSRCASGVTGDLGGVTSM